MSNLCTSFRWVFEKSCDSNNDENLKLVKRCEDKNLINVQHVSQKKQKNILYFDLNQLTLVIITTKQYPTNSIKYLWSIPQLCEIIQMYY